MAANAGLYRQFLETSEVKARISALEAAIRAEINGDLCTTTRVCAVRRL
jgi:hypothetical protein